MFLDSLIEAERYSRPRRCWAALASFALQLLLVAALVIVQFYYSAALPPVHVTAGRIWAPIIERLPFKGVVQVATVHVPGGRTGIQEPTSVPDDVYVPPKPETADGIPAGVDPSQATSTPGEGEGIGGPITGRELIAEVRKPPAAEPDPPAKPAALPAISRLSEGLLIRRVAPDYPFTAKVARVEGTVVLTAVISAEGRIEGLEVKSGHPMLIAAAMNAVKQWRYRPYVLNGRPTEAQAVITINFRLGGMAAT
jgi:protein TonB